MIDFHVKEKEYRRVEKRGKKSQLYIEFGWRVADTTYLVKHPRCWVRAAAAAAAPPPPAINTSRRAASAARHSADDLRRTSLDEGATLWQPFKAPRLAHSPRLTLKFSGRPYRSRPPGLILEKNRSLEREGNEFLLSLSLSVCARIRFYRFFGARKKKLGERGSAKKGQPVKF